MYIVTSNLSLLHNIVFIFFKITINICLFVPRGVDADAASDLENI